MLPRRFLVSTLTFVGLALAAGLLLFFARGYRLDINKREITGTGIILVTSTPDGALVYLNDLPQDATNTTIRNLSPGRYRLRVEKQGFTPWNKEVSVEQEVVTEEHALLIPLFPELKPLTFTGARNPILSPDRQKIAYQTSGNGAAGLYLLDLTDRPFNLVNRPNLLAADTAEREYSAFQLDWSPDSSQLLLTNLADKQETVLLDITNKEPSSITTPAELLLDWQTQKETAVQTLIESFPLDNQQIINEIANGVWSPDNSKVLFEESKETPSEQRVFKALNLKPKDLRKTSPELTTAFTYQGSGLIELSWFSDSEHLLILEKDGAEAKSGKIAVVEIGGTNLSQVFAGTIIGTTALPSPSGSRLIILTSFNPEIEQYNLYSINLR